MKSQLNDLKINFFPRVGAFPTKDKDGNIIKLTKEEEASNAKPVPVSAFITINKQPRIRIPGIAKVAPEDWIIDTQRVKDPGRAPAHFLKKIIADRINSEIDNADKAIWEVFHEHIEKYSTYPTDLEAFKVKCIIE